MIGELGRGGQAVVKLAVAPRLEPDDRKLVVLKAPHEDMQDEPDFERMLRAEAELMQRLDHPNIVKVIGIENFHDRAVVVMEYLEGQTLGRIQRRGEMQNRPLPAALHFRALLKAMEGLDYAHRLEDESGRRLRLVHRDVTPHNIFVSYNGSVKLLDFGIARLCAVSGQTSTGVIKGKLAYMAPEQVDGTKLDARADIFSVGVLLFEAICGERLWQDQSEASILRRLINGEIPDLLDVRPAAPPELARICRKALAAQREARYQTVRQLADELHDFVEANGLVVGDAELGHFVTELFAEKRSEMSKLIEGEIGRLASIERKRSHFKPRYKGDEVSTKTERFRPWVLVIDDSELSRELMLELLAEAGIPAIGMPTAIGAVQTVLSEDIRVVITDVNMPQVTGPELVRMVRAQPHTTGVRFILASALPQSQLKELATTIRVDGIVEKDQIEAELVEMVRALLGPQFVRPLMPGYA